MRNELRVWRARRRVSQTDVAVAAGITQTRQSRIENELEDPTPEQRAAMARFLDCPEAELFPVEQPQQQEVA